MSFQKPDLLWLLAALLVPLVLYLLPMPRRRVMSTALFLWERFLKSEMLGRTSERFRRALGLALAGRDPGRPDRRRGRAEHRRRSASRPAAWLC